jgi:signal transduction histidine kinase
MSPKRRRFSYINYMNSIKRFFLWWRSRWQISIDWFIGSDSSLVLLPTRLRQECMIGFLLMVLPVILAVAGFELVNGLHTFTFAKLVIAVIIVGSLASVKLGQFRHAIDVLFFGSILTLMAAVFAVAKSGAEFREVEPLLFLALFAAIALIGFYSESRLRLIVILAITLVFDVAVGIIDRTGGYEIVIPKLGVMVLHVVAYGIGEFLLYYFDRLNRVAEARRLMTRRLEELVAEARRSGNAKLETFSHDLRSPLTAVLGVQNLLAATDLSDDQRRYLELLSKANRLLLEIVESILKNDSGLESFAEAATLADTIDSAVAPFRAIAAAKGIVLRCDLVDGLPKPPMPVSALTRTVADLVDNALKYTESGSVVVAADVSAAAGRSLEIAVADTGRGMAPERLAAVRSGKAGPDAAVVGSAGRSLDSARKTVADAGGSLEIDSRPGEGTVVRLSFPLEG